MCKFQYIKEYEVDKTRLRILFAFGQHRRFILETIFEGNDIVTYYIPKYIVIN